MILTPIMNLTHDLDSHDLELYNNDLDSYNTELDSYNDLDSHNELWTMWKTQWRLFRGTYGLMYVPNFTKIGVF